MKKVVVRTFVLALALALAWPNLARAACGIGSTIWEGCSASWWIVFTAVITRRLSLSGSPVFGFTSKRGKLLLEMSTRMRCPCLNTLLVG